MRHILKFKEFKQKILNQETIDYEPYLSPSVDITYKIFMAENGIMVDELMESDIPEVIRTLINHDYGKEYYDTLVNHEDEWVRRALADKGYYLDTLVNDPANSVKYGVATRDKTYLAQIPLNHGTYYIHTLVLNNDENPDIDVLKRYIDAKELHNAHIGHRRPIFERKYEAMTTKPTMLEKTMTPFQLYQSDSCLWARGLAPRVIDNVLYGEALFGRKLSTDEFEIALTQTKGSIQNTIQNKITTPAVLVQAHNNKP